MGVSGKAVVPAILKVPFLIVPFLIVSLMVAGCTWVEPTEEGYAVALVKPTAVQNCQRLGTATAEVPDTVGPVPRSEKKVRRELVTLAKNEAARMGGDTVVAVGVPFQGRQKFRVYHCN